MKLGWVETAWATGETADEAVVATVVGGEVVDGVWVAAGDPQSHVSVGGFPPFSPLNKMSCPVEASKSIAES